jgi:hypothetical protein
MDSLLPIKRDLTLAYLGSLLIALLTLVASAAGLLFQTSLYPEQHRLASASTDGSNLIIALPILLGSLWLARRGSLFGLLCWPGALFYVLYTYAFYAISVPLSALFLPYLVLVTLSAYTIISLVANIDGEAVRQRLGGRVPARTAGGLLIAIAAILIVWDVVAVVTALASQTAVTSQTYVTWVVDLAVACPPLLIGGIQLWRRQALGYVVGAGLLLQIGALFVAVPVLLVLQALFAAVPLDVSTVVLLFIIGAIPFILLAFFARGAIKSQHTAALSYEKAPAEHAEAADERSTDEQAGDDLASSPQPANPIAEAESTS